MTPNKHEPIIMQTRGIHIHSYNNQNKMNFFQQQQQHRLIRQT